MHAGNTARVEIVVADAVGARGGGGAAAPPLLHHPSGVVLPAKRGKPARQTAFVPILIANCKTKINICSIGIGPGVWYNHFTKQKHTEV